MMAFSSLTSIPLSSSSSLYAPSISSPFRAFPQSNFHLKRNNNYSNFSLKAQTLDFTGSFFEGGLGSEDDDEDDDDIVLPGTGFADLEEREEPQCPPGLRPYETMVVLRPDMSEDERLALTQKYEEVQFSPFSTSFYVFLFDKF
jgi:small subunit ribosomal protein S6